MNVGTGYQSASFSSAPLSTCQSKTQTDSLTENSVIYYNSKSVRRTYPDNTYLEHEGNKNTFVSLRFNPSDIEDQLIQDLSDEQSKQLLYLHTHIPDQKEKGEENQKEFTLYPMKVVDVKHLNEAVFTVQLKPQHDAFTYESGQMITVYFDVTGKTCHSTKYPAQDIVEVRHYSGSSSQKLLKDHKIVEITISRVYDAQGNAGRATGFFSDPDTIGKTVYAHEGRFGLTLEPLKKHHKNIVFIGTTTGLAPLKSFLPELLETGKPIQALMGFRTKDAAIWTDYFEEMAGKNQQFSFQTEYSQTQAGHPKNYVTSHLNELPLDPKSTLVYICGNPNMVDAVEGMLKNNGFSEEDVATEAFGHSGLRTGIIQGFSATSERLITPSE